MFDNLRVDDTIVHDGDFLGGGSYLLDTDAYTMAIDMAYIDKSKGGAMSLNLVLKGKNNETIRQQWWMTSGEAKGCKNYYEDKKGTKNYLPGFSAANNFTLLAIGKDISSVNTEEKVLSLYDYGQRKEVPTKKQVIVELLGAEIIVGVEKQTVDKTAKNEATGNYEPTGETRQVNEIVKSFRAKDSLSAAEIRAEATEAVFLPKWVEKNKGNVVDKSIGVAASKGSTGVAGAPTQSGSTSETKSLF